MRAISLATLLIAASSIAPALAAPAQPGDPFHATAGTAVVLEDGATFMFRVVRDERCPYSVNISCLWQGEAFLEVELQVAGRSAREPVTTERRDITLLERRVRLLGLYPPLIEGNEKLQYVAMFRVAPVSPEGSVKSLRTPDQAIRAAGHHVRAYAESAQQVCDGWQARGLLSYWQASGGLCEMAAKVVPTPYALWTGSGWRVYFRIDNPQLMAEIGQPLFWFVEVNKGATDVLDQFGAEDASPLDCSVRLLQSSASGPCGPD